MLYIIYIYILFQETLKISVSGAEISCRAIFNLAMNENNRIKLGTVGVCEIVATIIQLYVSIPSVIIAGCKLYIFLYI